MKTGRLLILLILLLFSGSSTLFGLVYNYNDSFNTTEYMDFSKSSGSWDAEQGQLRLSVESHSLPTLISRNIGNINSVTFTSNNNNGIAVGENALLMTWEANEWRVMYYSQQQDTLNAVDLYSDAGGYAVGQNGIVLSIETSTWSWSSVGNNPTTNLNGIDSKAANRTWIVGDNGQIWFFNGNDPGGFSLQSIAAPAVATNLNAVAMTREIVGTDYWGYAVGDNGVVLTTEDSGATAWAHDAFFPAGVTANLNDVFVGRVGASPRVWVVGDGGVIYYYNGSGTWTQQAVGLTTDNLKSIYLFHPGGFPTAWVGFAVGERGTVLVFDNVAWTKQSTIFHQDINDVFILSTGFSWLVGEDTLFARWDGATWTPGQLTPAQNPNFPFITGSDINDIDFYSNASGFFVGEDGTSYRWDGANWNYIDTTPYVNALYSVSAYGLNQAYAVGEIDTSPGVNTSLFRFDSGLMQWVNMAYPGTPAVLRDVHILNANYGLAVGDTRALIELNGLPPWSVPTSVPAVPAASFTNLYGVWCFHDGTDFSGSVIVGSRTGGGAIGRLSGGSWVVTTTSATMRSVSMVGRDFGVVVGDSGGVYIYNGSTWTNATAGTGLTSNLTRVYAPSTNEIYITDSVGHMYMYQYDAANNRLSNQKVRTDPGFGNPVQTVQLNSTGVPKRPLPTDTRRRMIHFAGNEGTLWQKPDESYADNVINNLTSKKINTATQINIYSVEVTAVDNANGQTISYFASNNGGTTWEGPVVAGVPWLFSSFGSDLRYKAALNSTLTTTTPYVSSISVAYGTDQTPPTDPAGLDHQDINTLGLMAANVWPLPFDNDTNLLFSWTPSQDADTSPFPGPPAGYKVQIMTTDVNASGTSAWSPVFTIAATFIDPPGNTRHGFTLSASSATWGAWRAQNSTGYYLSIAAYDGFDQTSNAMVAIDYVRCDLTAPNAPANFRHNENPALPGRSNVEDFTADQRIGYVWSTAADNWPNNINYYLMRIYEYDNAWALISTSTRTIASGETGYTLEAATGFTVDDGEHFSVELWAVDNSLFTAAAKSMTVPVTVDLTPPTNPGVPTHSDGTEHASIVANATWDDDVSLNWTWAASTDANMMSYEVTVFRVHPLNGRTLVSTSFADSNIFTYTPATNELTYEVVVIAVDKAGQRSNPMTSALVTVDMTPPSAPTALAAVQDLDSNADGFNPRPGYNDDGRIRWNWTEASPKDNLAFRRYVVNQSVDNGSTYPVTAFTTSAYYIGNWVNGNHVMIQVGGVDACGLTSAAFATPLTGVTVDTDIPVFPAGAICEGNDPDPIPANWDNDTNVEFTWTAATDATSNVAFYRIQVLSYETGVGWHGAGVAAFTVASNSYTHPLGVDDVGFRLVVNAIDYAGNVSAVLANSTVVTVETTAVGDPSNVWHSDDANNPYDNDSQLVFTWEAPAASASIAYYNIYVSANDGTTFNATPSFTVAATTCTVDVTAGTDGDLYNIQVQAVSTISLVGNKVTGSADLYNPNVPVRLDRVAPIQPVVTHTDDAAAGYDNDSSLEFSWTPVAPANDVPLTLDWFGRYDIYVRTNGVGWVYKTQQTTNNYTATGQNGFSYEVAVVPYDAAGNKGATGEAGPIRVITSVPPIPDQPLHTDDAPAGFDNDSHLRFTWTTPPDGTIQWVRIYAGLDGPVNTTAPYVTVAPGAVTSPSLGYTLEVGLAGNGHNYGIKVEYVNYLGASSGLSMTSTPFPVQVVIGAPNQPNQPVLSEEVLNPPYCGNQVKFAWRRKTENTQLLEYKVYVQVNGADVGPFTINTLKPPGYWHTYTYNGVNDNDTVRVRVSAVGIAGSESVRSTWSSNAIGDLVNPTAPVITDYTPNPADADNISVELTTLSTDSHPPIKYQVQGTAYSSWTTMAGPPFNLALSQNQNNLIRIRAVDAAGRIGNYDEIQVQEDSVGPGSAGKPIHTDDAPDPWDNDQSLHIRWSAPAQGTVSTYQVYVSVNDGPFVNVDAMTTEFYTYSTAQGGESDNYRFRIRAVDNLGRFSWSEMSDYVYVDTIAPRPEPVVNLGLYPVDWRTGYHTVHRQYFTVELSTIVTTDVNGFKYQIKGGLIGDWTDTVPADGVGGKKFVFPLVADTLNSLEIRAIDPANNSTNYNPAVNTNFRLQVMEKSAPPPQPSEPKHDDADANAGFDNDTSLDFDWDDLSLESDIVKAYQVYVSVNSGNYFLHSTVLTHEVNITGVEGNYYRVKVKAVDIYGNAGEYSPYSNNILVDMTPAKVLKSSIVDGERFVATTSYIEVTFDEDMDQDSLLTRGNVVLVGEDNIQVDGKVEYDPLKRLLKFTPYEALGHDKDYRFVLTTNVKDAAGNKLQQAVVISFHTLPPEGLKIMKLLNYPNPIKTTGTSFAYYLSQDSDEVVITVYGVDGRRLIRLEGCPTWEGYNEIFWDGLDKDGFALANGTYLVKAVVTKAGKTDSIRSKIMVLK